MNLKIDEDCLGEVKGPAQCEAVHALNFTNHSESICSSKGNPKWNELFCRRRKDALWSPQHLPRMQDKDRVFARAEILSALWGVYHERVARR